MFNTTAEVSFANLVQNTSNAVVVTDLDGRIIFCNNGFTNITGYTFDEVEGQKPGNFLQGPETNPLTIQRISEKIKNHQRVNESILNYHKDGSTYWLQLDIFPIFDETGLPTHFMAIESVITDYKIGEQIAEENRIRLEGNITYAKKLQDALFRKEAESNKHIFTDIFILDRPKDQVGGDFYIIDQIQNKKVVLAGDCTGHGASGAILTALCTSTIKANLNKYKTLSPSLVLQKSIEQVKELLTSDETEIIRDNMEATLMFIDETKEEIKFASTSQELYLVGVHEDQKISPNKVKVDGQYEIQDQALKYHTGSMIYVGSDGFKDQFGSETGKKLSARRLHAQLSEVYARTCSEQKDFLEELYDTWKGNVEDQTDDLLMIGIRL